MMRRLTLAHLKPTKVKIRVSEHMAKSRTQDNISLRWIFREVVEFSQPNITKASVSLRWFRLKITHK